ncbi:hypothetical protein BaRGS_00022556 [Batillaria attramentaria]|uniref:Uncharacterized protein n=1 Tax=Batillaria attramentaria TaxID=370345 RepID=A0ABD0KG66_9CAEN
MATSYCPLLSAVADLQQIAADPILGVESHSLSVEMKLFTKCPYGEWPLLYADGETGSAAVSVLRKAATAGHLTAPECLAGIHDTPRLKLVTQMWCHYQQGTGHFVYCPVCAEPTFYSEH